MPDYDLPHLEKFQPYVADADDDALLERAALYEAVEGDGGLQKLFADIDKAATLGLIAEKTRDRARLKFWRWGRRLTPDDVALLKSRWSR